MFTEVEIRKVIDKIKDMKPVEYTSLVFDIANTQSQLSTFINGGHYKVINRAERGCLNYYVQIVYLLYKEKYGTMTFISTTQLEKEKASCFEHDIFNESATKECTLEDYLKQLIHADFNIRTKSVRHIVATTCACINIFHELGE